MNISTTAIRPSLAPVQANRAPAAQPSTSEPAEAFTFSGGDGVGWGDAAVGLASGVVNGAILGAGAGLSAAKHSIIGTGEAYKALWTNETVGPVLKTVAAVLMPIATIGVPLASVVVGAGVGLYKGFVDGATNGFSTSVSNSFKTISEFDNDLAPKVRNGIREFGNEKLGEGEEKFDVSPIRGAGAIVAGVGNTVVGGLGIGVSTVSQIPEAFITANRAIAQSDIGLPLKTVAHIVTAPLAALAVPAGFGLGALFGLGAGTYHGYTDGMAESFNKTTGYIKQYHTTVDDGLARWAEDLVKNPPEN